MKKVVALVPFTSSDSSRTKIWSWVKNWWEQNTDVKIIVGEDHGTFFNKSLATNRASDLAGDWEVALILDSDTIVPPEQVEEGIRLARETKALVFPFTERWELSPEGTELLMNNESSDWQKDAGKYRWQSSGGCVIVHRELWDLVRGYDPGFVGWGYEDGGFLISCTLLSGKDPIRVPGKHWHLEHTPAEEKSPTHPVYKANEKRYFRYMKAAGKPNAKELLREIREETIGIV